MSNESDSSGNKMKRRDFLHHTVLGGAAAFASATAFAQPSGAASAMAPTANAFELEETTFADLQAGMQSGKYTARSLVETYLDRIAAHDQSGPAVNAVIEINPDARDIADQMDEVRRKHGPKGPLHGIPIMLKDNIDTADRMQTTAGSRALIGQLPKRDAFLVQRLREAGAVILGKTNLSEWANFRSTRSVSGWSGRGGQTRNPYALDRNPCGSSSGSGAAVSANFCAAAIGTETDGSIVCPSSTNGIVGIKPTVGLISRSGIIPISHSQDTAGPMARTVADAAVLLGAMVASDPEDPATANRSGKVYTDYAQFLDPNGLRGARIGVARNFFGFHERVDALMEQAIDAMKRHGAVIVDALQFANLDKLDKAEYDVLLYEFKADLNAYLSRRGAKSLARSLESLIQYNEQHRDREMPYFTQEIFIQAQAKGPLTSPEYAEALQTSRKLARDEGIDALRREHKLDAIIAPTGGPAWVTDLITGDHGLGGSSSVAAVAGYPNITVPAGYVFGLPVGISFFAGAYTEPTLIKIAYAFEQATKVRKPPRFLPTANLT